ncbi:hypothetical protein Neosp_005451 [[Neocosmospora] mangrovei]
MPGATSPAFWVNIGIPQGSPVSPILFPFFSAPILEKASKCRYKGATIYIFAYVDDTYIFLNGEQVAFIIANWRRVLDEIRFVEAEC